MENLASFYVNYEDQEGKSLFEYAMTAKGIMETRHSPIADIRMIKNHIPALPEIEEGFDLKVPRIPYSVFQKVIAFFKRVYEKYQSEALCQVYWDPKAKKYEIFVPEQKVTASTVSWEPVNAVPENPHWLLVMEAHSHASMSSFFSSTDDKDHKSDIFYLVVGKLNQPECEFKLRLSSNGKYLSVKPDQLIELPTYTASEEELLAWIENVTLKKEELSHPWSRSYLSRPGKKLGDAFEIDEYGMVVSKGLYDLEGELKAPKDKLTKTTRDLIEEYIGIKKAGQEDA